MTSQHDAEKLAAKLSDEYFGEPIRQHGPWLLARVLTPFAQAFVDMREALKIAREGGGQRFYGRTLARLVLEQEAEIERLRAAYHELREDFGKCADLALMASSYWPELSGSWTGTVSERLALTLGKEHEARMDAEAEIKSANERASAQFYGLETRYLAEITELNAKLDAQATDHHRRWPDCPTCHKWAADDLAGASENSRLRASLAECEQREAEAHGYGSRLFKALAPQCEPLDDVIGVLTQLDNWSVGVRERALAAEARMARLEEALKVEQEVHFSTTVYNDNGPDDVQCACGCGWPCTHAEALAALTNPEPEAR